MSPKKDKSKNKDKIIQEFLKGGEKTKRTYKSSTDPASSLDDKEVVEISHFLDDSYLNDFSPLEVRVTDGNVERSVRFFRSAVQKEKIISDYKQRMAYEKPSDKKRRKKNEMIREHYKAEVRKMKILSGEFEKEMEKKQLAKEKKMQERMNKRNESTEA